MSLISFYLIFVIMYTESTSVKKAKWFTPNVRRIDFAAINVDASKWLENDFAGCGVLFRGANGMPLICQISRHPCANALQAEVKANLEGYKIVAAQSRFNMVSLHTDAGLIVDFVADNKTNKSWSMYERVEEDIELCQDFLRMNPCWNQFFIQRGLNIVRPTAMFIDKYFLKSKWNTIFQVNSLSTVSMTTLRPLSFTYSFFILSGQPFFIR
jgi:hypothetical protein